MTEPYKKRHVSFNLGAEKNMMKKLNSNKGPSRPFDMMPGSNLANDLDISQASYDTDLHRFEPKMKGVAVNAKNQVKKNKQMIPNQIRNKSRDIQSDGENIGEAGSPLNIEISRKKLDDLKQRQE